MDNSSFTEWLFWHLWTKHSTNPVYQTGVLIPQTVFFKWNKPTAWYGSKENTRELEVVRRNLEHTTEQDLFDSFTRCRDRSKSQVVASYFSEEQIRHSDIDFEKNPMLSNYSSVVWIEYLNEKYLRNLLFDRNKENSSFIQQFIDPTSFRNGIVKF